MKFRIRIATSGASRRVSCATSMSGSTGSEDHEGLRQAHRPRSGSATRTPMIRPVFTELALFAAPFGAYGLFLWATRAGVLDVSSWPLPRLMWLTITSLVLMIASLLVLAEF